jgi:hypothetical protein
MMVEIDIELCVAAAEKRLRMGTQRGDTAATCDAWFGGLVDATPQCPLFAYRL